MLPRTSADLHRTTKMIENFFGIGTSPKVSKNQPFRAQFTYPKRKEESDSIRLKHPDHCPVIIEKRDGSMLPDISRKKYLVPGVSNMAKVVMEVRRNVPLNSTEAIYLTVCVYNKDGSLKDERMVPPSQPMDFIYQAYKDWDGFLYIQYSGENTFG